MINTPATVKTREVELPFGTVTLVDVALPGGAMVQLSSLGAGITRIAVPDAQGRVADVAMRYGDIASYLGDGPCAGKTPGRYANRIGCGSLTVEGKHYELPVNCGPHHLHGGPDGFQNKIWSTEVLPDGARFTLVSPDGDQGYPGELLAAVTYHWLPDMTLAIDYEATAKATTVVNLTNHTYFNLNGLGTGSAMDHTLRLYCSRWADADSTLLPTGRLNEVAGTPMDFTAPKRLGADINADFQPLRDGKGYDHCFAVDGWEPGRLLPAADLSAQCGRKLRIASDQPAMQLYTGNWLTGSPAGPDGLEYHDYDFVAIECQGYPDAPNLPDCFPSQELKPGQTYRRRIEYSFSIL